MRKITLLSLIAVSVLFTACGEESQKTATEATAKTAETPAKTAEVTKEETQSDLEKATADAAEATKKAAEELAKVAKAEAQKAGDAAKKAVTGFKEKALATTAAATKMAKDAMSDTSAGEAVYAKCSGCHGKDGKTKALGKSEVIAGQSAQDLEKKMAEYKAGTRDVAGMGTLMSGQLASMSDEDIEAVSAYISSM